MIKSSLVYPFKKGKKNKTQNHDRQAADKNSNRTLSENDPNSNFELATKTDDKNQSVYPSAVCC